MKPGLWVSPSYGPAVFRPSVKRPDLASSFTAASLPSEDHGESPIDTPTLCLAAEPYRSMFQDALFHHAETNGVRSFKFDGHRFQCCNAAHGHLPGKYSVEPLMDALIATIEQLRQRAPEVLIIWYWGVRSPWWLLHGDMLYEHGIHMEAATPADSPSVLMRQSVTVSLDQGADYAWDRVPLLSQDSLGVWISDTRWGNWMKTEGWQDAWVMDIARGSMLAQLWGDLSLFHEGDVDFLARMSSLLRNWEGLLGHTRRILSDPWSGEPYGYAHSDGARALVAVHNPGFSDHTITIPLGRAIGLPDAENAQHYLIRRLHPASAGPTVTGSQIRAAGATVSLPLGPFQVVMLQIEPTADTDDQPFPESTGSLERSRRLVCRMAEVSRKTLAWEMPDTIYSMALKLARRAINGRAQYIDTEDLFRQSALHSDPRDRALTNRQLAGECTLPPIHETSCLIVTARASRDGVFWHHRALFDIIRLQLTLDGHSVGLSTTPRRWHEQAGGWSWIAFSCVVEPAASATRVTLKAQVCLPDSVSLKWQAWLLRNEDVAAASTGG
jgi:hypothetical protein